MPPPMLLQVRFGGLTNLYRNTPRHLFKYPPLQKILFYVYTGASVTKTCEKYGTRVNARTGY
jgi:hypothetical protein